MTKFTDIKLGDEMYSVVFGLGRVVFVLAKLLRLDGYYMLLRNRVKTATNFLTLKKIYKIGNCK